MSEQFLGSAMEEETSEEHIAREAEWKQDHACPLCNSFECDGNHQDTWYDYAEKVGILEGENAE